MRNKLKQDIYVDGNGLWCAAGDDIRCVLEALKQDRQRKTPLSFPADWLPYDSVFTVAEPDISVFGVDRKMLRTMEKQSIMALYSAFLPSSHKFWEAYVDKTRIGLYLGTPTVEEEIPTWAALEEIHQRGRQANLTEVFLSETQPFSGLLLLNSTACAHISNVLGIMGAMGAYSPFADAGLEAVIEAALSISEGENDAAIAGGVSQKINPFLFIQYEAMGMFQTGAATEVPGEGAAFLTISNSHRYHGKPPVRLAGYGRSFSARLDQRLLSRIHSMRQALDIAGITPDDVDWIFFDPSCAMGGRELEMQALETLFNRSSHELFLGGVDRVCGFMGPATPVMNTVLAIHGMRNGYRIRVDRHGRYLAEESTAIRNVLLNASGFQGQFVSVILQNCELL